MRSRAPASPARRGTVVCHVEDDLLTSSSCFPYFMVVALESGSLLKAILLLALYPVLCLLREETKIEVMSLISFCGVSVGSHHLGISVLPKHLLDNVGSNGFKILMAGKKKVCISRMPKLMVEEFLRKYLKVDVVLAREMKVAGGYYTGVMEEKGNEGEILVERELAGNDNGLFGVSEESKTPLHPLFSRCQERITVRQAKKKSGRQLPIEDHLEPLVFHDGRIAFRPTPLSSFAMFVWLPFGVLLAFFRLLISILLPYRLSTPALALSGTKNRVINSPFTPKHLNSSPGRLFVCNHRTLLDPIQVSWALSRPVTAVAYGLSPLSRFLSPIKTVMLTRTRDRDRALIERELEKGDLAICPEGTTCREPFLLRFSPLFAELAEEVIPVAINTQASMFYGTTAGGSKSLDPFFVILNPYTLYTVEFLDRMMRGEGETSSDFANRTQEAIGAALGFCCTKLTRKDKYLALAGNEGNTLKSE